MYRRIFTLGAVAIVVAAFALAVSPWQGPEQAGANPPGAPTGKKVFQFNYIARPAQSTNDPNCGNGAKIFTERGAGGQHILWTLDPTGGIDILDCKTEALDGSYAHVTADAQDTYWIYVVLLGPNKSDNSLSICRSLVIDDTGTELCELGSVSLSRGGGVDRYTFPTKLFADIYESELWTLEQGTNFRHAQVRLYVDR
jgi:hypothetical protein